MQRYFATLAAMRKAFLPFLLLTLGVSIGFSQTYTTGNWTYTIDYSDPSAGKATITSYSGPGGSVVIPATLAGLQVVAVGAANPWSLLGPFVGPFESVKTSMSSVTIPDGVTRIGSGAFYGCTGLTDVTIPDSVTSIGAFGPGYLGAFYGCTGLTNVSLPQNLQSIGDSTFADCTGLTSVSIPDSVASIGSSAFAGCTGLTSVTYPKGLNPYSLYSGSSIFSGCTGLTSVTIPHGVTGISSYAFSGCASLADVTIPDSVTRIENNAFAQCTSLNSVTVGSGVTYIAAGAFDSSTELTSIYFRGNMPSVGGAIFGGITPAGIVYYPVGSAGWGATYVGWPTQAYILPPTPDPSPTPTPTPNPSPTPTPTPNPSPTPTPVTEWTYDLNGSNEAIITGFAGLGGAVEIPSSIDGYPVKQVGYNWMPIFGYSNTSVTSVTIPNSVTSIGDNAFYECKGLTDVTIPDSVTSIGSSAFQSCTGLASVSIPDSVTSIGVYAFDGCTGLTTVLIPSRFTAQIGAIGFVGQLATDLMANGLVEAITQRVIAAVPNNYGIATKTDLDAVISNTVLQVQASPNSYSLYSAQQYADNYDSGVTAGTALVTQNPASYNLYTSNSIMDLRMGGLMVQKQGGNAVISFQPQTTTDLTQPFTNNGTPITNTIPMPGNKGFLRIQAR